MATTFTNLSHFREPEGDNWDTDILPEIPTGTDTNISKVNQPHFPSSDAGYTIRTRTTSLGSVPSAKPSRTRKSSSSTRGLVRVLLEENLLDSENTHAQLAHAYDVLRAESRRAAEAERVALETRERLRSITSSRMEALKEASRAQSELRAYKLQFEAAQQRIRDANELTKQAETEKERSERKLKELRKIVDKYRENMLTQLAKEEGVREGRREVLRELTKQSYNPIVASGYNDIPMTPSDATVLPVPPPASVLVRSRRSTTPRSRYGSPPLSHPPDVLVGTRQPPTPSRRAHTPVYPIPPPVTQPLPPPPSLPILPRQTATPVIKNSREGPDDIIIRSPVAIHPGAHSITRPSSSASRLRNNVSSPVQSPSRASGATYQQHGRHHSIDPAVLGAMSAGRIYTDNSTDTDSDTEFPSQPPPPPFSQIQGKQWLPKQEVIIPRPAPTPGPSQQKILVSSPSHYSSRDKITGPPILRRSSTSSSTSQDLDLPQFPRVLALRRRDGNARRMSLESDSSVPSIQIEPPTRSSSEASLATTVAGHLLPTGDVAQELDFSAPPAGYDIPNRQRSYSMHGSQYEYSRPQSRTGFRYGPASPTASTIRPVIPGISAQNTLANNAPHPHISQTADGLPSPNSASDYYNLHQQPSTKHKREPAAGGSPNSFNEHFNDEVLGRPGYTPRPNIKPLNGHRPRNESMSRMHESAIHSPFSQTPQPMYEDFEFDVGSFTRERNRRPSTMVDRNAENSSRNTFRRTPYVQSSNLMD